MNDPLVVVGSGASGLHFAVTALEKGRRVTLLDVGHAREQPVLPDADLAGVKARHADPFAYFLGADFGSLILPGHDGEYYGFPPGKEYVFRQTGGVTARARGFAPLFSFATGGLAEAWTGGSYTFNDADLREFPFDFAEFAPWYERVARRIGVSGTADDLAPFLPPHDGLQPPLDLDGHSAALLDAYAARRERMNTRHGLYLGRARSAVLSRPLADRPACDRLGRCLWGCPTDAFYTPSVTLRALRAHPAFTYVPGVRVEHFTCGDGGRIARVHATDIATGAARSFETGTLVLAAGTLCTAKIVLDSLRRAGAGDVALAGLSDNRQVMMPFVTLSRIGHAHEPRSFQYHQLALALTAEDPFENVHGLVTTLKTALVHPVVQSIPTSLGTALRAFRDVRAALALLNVNFPDRRRPGNRVTLEADGDRTRLVVEYAPPPGEAERIQATLARLRGALRALGCIAPRGMVHVRPMGASVHYTGTLPMQATPAPFTTDATCRVRDFENLWVADGSTFPALPAKNLTFTLMANATRIAELCA